MQPQRTQGPPSPLRRTANSDQVGACELPYLSPGNRRRGDRRSNETAINPAGVERIRVRFIVSAEAEMSDLQREIYHSENGDRWLLCRDDDGRVFVLHKANVSSGGTATKIELGDFLGRGKARPEHQAPCRLIGGPRETG